MIIFFMKKIILILVLFFFHSTAIADKYVGRGELKLHDIDIKNFMEYLAAPAGQYPLVFLVIAEDGKAIWSSYWYCPEGNCATLYKPKVTRKCAKDAEKY